MSVGKMKSIILKCVTFNDNLNSVKKKIFSLSNCTKYVASFLSLFIHVSLCTHRYASPYANFSFTELGMKFLHLIFSGY